MILYADSALPQFSDSVVALDNLLLGVEIDGVAWIFDTLDGWSLGGGVSTNFAPRPTAHGEFDGPVYRRSRIITIGGTCIADSPALAEDAIEALGATLADGRMGTLSVQTPTRTLSADVRLSDTPQASWLTPRVFRWALQFTAPDPRKYGLTNVGETSLPSSATSGLIFPLAGPVFDFGSLLSDGRISLSNNGTAPSEPVFTVTGPLASGFEVTHLETGRRLRYPLTVGSPIVLDCREGRATTDGQERTGNLSVREWFVVPPRSSATFRFSTLGTETPSDPASLSAALAPAYF